jgi:hypothetical protein
MMVYSLGRKSPHDTDPVNEVIGGEAVWADLRFQDPESVDRLAKIPGRVPLGQGYAVACDSAPKSFLWKSTSKAPPDYAFGNNSVMLVSSRFRNLVETFEPNLHQFLAVSMHDSKTSPEPFDEFYWFVCCNLIDSLDPEHTTITWGPPNGDYNAIKDGLRLGSWRFDPSITPAQKPVFSLQAIGKRVLWRDPYWGREIVHCSDEFGEAMIAANLTGFGLHRWEQI